MVNNEKQAVESALKTNKTSRQHMSYRFSSNCFYLWLCVLLRCPATNSMRADELYFTECQAVPKTLAII